MLAQFSQEGIDVSGNIGRIDGNDGRDVNGLKLCFPMSLVLMLTSTSDGRDRVWRRNGERFAECCVKQRDRWGGGSVLVWGGITADNRTQLHVLDRSINAKTYRDQIF